MVAVDSATVRAHRRGRGPVKVAPADKPRDHTLGRSRGWTDDEDSSGRRRPCNTGERCINRLKQWRGLAARYDKTAAIFLWDAR